MKRVALPYIMTLFSYGCATMLSAQARNTHWLTANCWLSFSTATNQVLPMPPEMGPGGLMSISDPNGQLLLTYSGLAELRDGQFQLVENQQSAPMFWGESTSLFMPVPGQPERTFLFHYRYFSADVRKFGFMEIGPDGVDGQMSVTDTGTLWFMLNPARKCTGIAHANGEDYWFLTQAGGTNEVHAFRIGVLGVDEGPVVSPGGVVLAPELQTGFMVASAQGDRFISQAYNVMVPNETFIELYTFDPATGTASLQHSFADMSGQYWGAEFSPSGRYLYILKQDGVDDGSGNSTWRYTLYQYDLLQTDIESSRLTIATQNYFLGGMGFSKNNMALAPNGKIYINRFPTSGFAVINAPDEGSMACAFEETGWSMGECTPSVPHMMKYYHDDLGLGAPELNEPALTVWPNPLQDKGTLRHAADGPVHLRWSDALGRVVLTGRGMVIGGQLELHTGSLATGQYLLSVTHVSGRSVTTRVNVMR